jgi:hypothetical protein
MLSVRRLAWVLISAPEMQCIEAASADSSRTANVPCKQTLYASGVFDASAADPRSSTRKPSERWLISNLGLEPR